MNKNNAETALAATGMSESDVRLLARETPAWTRQQIEDGVQSANRILAAIGDHKTCPVCGSDAATVAAAITRAVEDLGTWDGRGAKLDSIERAKKIVADLDAARSAPEPPKPEPTPDPEPETDAWREMRPRKRR